MARPGRISLVPQRPDHAEGLFRALSDPRVHAFLDGGPPHDVAAVRARIIRLAAGAPAGSGETWLNWSVFLDDRIVGYTQATITADLSATIAYVFSPEVWGRGVATIAALQMMAMLTRDHGVTRFLADTEVGNIASQGLLRRLGFGEIRRDAREVFFEWGGPAGI